jgi:hypothetical protein
MTDNKRTAESMKFLTKYDYSVTGSIYNLSLRTNTKLGLYTLAFIEFLFHFFLSYILPMPEDPLYLFAIVGSVLRLFIFYYSLTAINCNDFEKCYKGTILLQIATGMHTINCLVLSLAIILEKSIFGYRVHLDCSWPLIILGACSVIFNLYVSYLMFSFSKHLGMGNLDIIDGINQNALMSGSKVSFISTTTLVIGDNTPSHDINYLKARSAYISIDKIMLTDPRDVQFAQSVPEAVVNGMTLPSGIKIPYSDGKYWRIQGNEIILY